MSMKISIVSVLLLCIAVMLKNEDRGIQLCVFVFGLELGNGLMTLFGG